jgi:predicted ATPase
MAEKAGNEVPLKGITKITVRGFKSLAKETSIDIKPLTILAGANNSGKSSIMQPLLMMKQTIEESIEPVSDLDIDGDYVNYNVPEEFLSKANSHQVSQFSIKLELDENLVVENVFKNTKMHIIKLYETVYKTNNDKGITIRHDLNVDELIKNNPIYNVFLKSVYDGFNQMKKEKNSPIPPQNMSFQDLGIGLLVRRKRCLLGMAIDNLDTDNGMLPEPVFLPVGQEHQQLFEKYLLDIIHVPANRGYPKRSYKTTVVGHRFKGPINEYVASIIYDWKKKNATELITLEKWLRMLELTSSVYVDRSSDNRVVLSINRLPECNNSEDKDLVNITDVGFGISQVLPVLVSLLVAKKGQMIYIEQPEVHLHPRAQYHLANCFAETANRGVHIIIETHSPMLLINIQTLVAKKSLMPEKVVLHWFERSKNGSTNVRTGSMDNIGAYGDWPADFADVSYEANRDYLNATGFKIGK